MKAPLSYVPVLPATAGVIVGILLYSLGAYGISITVALAAFIILYALRRHFLAFFCLFTALGVILSVVHRPNPLPEGLFNAEHSASGTVKSVHETALGTDYTIDIDSIDGIAVAPVRCRISDISATAHAQRGEYVAFIARFRPVESDIDLPHEADYGKNLKSVGIQCRCTLYGAHIATLRPPDDWDIRNNRLRDSLYNAIVTSPVDGATASFLVAVILGDDSMLIPQDRDAFRAVGVAHILALSGMHVGIIATLLIFLLLPLQGTIRGHNIRAIITVLLIWGYAVIVGFTPSIVRAAVMLSVFSAAWLIQRGYRPFNALLLSVLVILCINPQWLYAPGMQLSVCAVAAILAFCWIIPKNLRKHRFAYYLINTLGIPVAAMMGTGLISVFHFGTFPLLFLFGNIVTGFLFPPILMGGTVLMLLNLCGIHFGFLGFCISWLYGIMHSAIEWLAGFRWAVVDGLFIDGISILPYLLCVILLTLSIKRLKDLRLWLLTIIFGLLTVITILLTAEDIPAAELYITRTPTTRIVMCQGGEAALWTDSNDTDSDMVECNQRYSRFLHSRHCGDSFVNPYDMDMPAFAALSRRVITADNLSLCIVYDDTIPYIQSHNASYALICRGYRGTIADVLTATGADTVLLAANINHKVRARLIRECSDSVPFLDLRSHRFSRVWQ